MQLMVIAEAADAFACDFVDHCASKGVRAVRAGMAEAAVIFTVKVANGIADVQPSIPLFVRACGAGPDDADFDAEFFTSELTATVWGAAALTSARVVNRPTENGYFANLVGLASLTEHAAGAPPRPEVHSSALAPFAYTGWWVENLACGKTHAINASTKASAEPHRLRPGFVNPGYEQVIVVGAKAWPMSSAKLSHLGLVRKSVDYVERLGLQCVSLTYAVSANLDKATLVQVDPWPQLQPQHQMRNQIFDALLEELLS